MQGHSDKYYINKLTPLGKVLWLLFAFRLLKNGDGSDAVFHWWHPLALPLVCLNILVNFIVNGAVGVNVMDNPFTLSKYFRENPDRVAFISRKSFWSKG